MKISFKRYAKLSTLLTAGVSTLALTGVSSASAEAPYYYQVTAYWKSVQFDGLEDCPGVNCNTSAGPIIRGTLSLDGKGRNMSRTKDWVGTGIVYTPDQLNLCSADTACTSKVQLKSNDTQQYLDIQANFVDNDFWSGPDDLCTMPNGDSLIKKVKLADVLKVGPFGTYQTSLSSSWNGDGACTVKLALKATKVTARN